MLRGKGPLAVIVDFGGIEDGAEIVFEERLDLLDLVAGAEAVEDVEERDAGFQGGRVGDGGKVHGLLDGRGKSMAHPVIRADMTSLWSPKMESPCVARERAATWKTVEVSSPEIL